jgi:outer membrane receptor protein involved in Fe transport
VSIAVAVALYGSAGAVRADNSEGGLQEVTVTATRRETSVLDVPYNIQAVSGQALEAQGISSLADLTRVLPGLAVFDEGPRTSGNRNTFNIRGLNANSAWNNDDNPSLTQPAVSTYFGEIPVFFPFKLTDIDRIEVLRGPQGTLYGSSSIGGTVRVIPKAPDPSALTFEVNADIAATKNASSPSYDASLTVNVPLGDRSAFRATGGHEYLSGFIDAVDLVKQTGTPMNPGAVVPQNPAEFLTSPAAQAPNITNYNMADIDYVRASLKWGISDRVTTTFNFAYQQNNAQGRYEDNPYYGTYQQYQYYGAFASPQISKIQLYDLDVAVDLGFAQLTSASGATLLDTDGVSDASGFLQTHLASYYFGYPRLFAPEERTQNVDTYSQELRLVSKAGGRFDWITGLFFQSSHTSFHYLQNVPGINVYTNAVLATPSPVNFTDTLATGWMSSTRNDVAAYGELTWHVTDRWQVTGGARVFRDSLDGVSGFPLPYASLTTQYLQTGVANNPYLLGGYYPLNARTTKSIYKFNPSVKINDDTLAYLTVSQGFRPGGANALPATDPLGNDNRPYLLYNPDTDTNYEIGIKGTTPSKHFSYTATLFLVDWKNFQATLYTPFGVNYVANVAPARSQGVELDFDGQLMHGFSYNLTYAYIDAYVRQSFLYQAGLPSSEVPAGSPLPGSAKNNAALSLQYTLPVSNASSLTFRANASYRGPAQTNFADLPTVSASSFVELPSITIVGASATFDKGPYAVTLYGDNLTNSRGTTQAISAAFFGPRYQSYGVIRPRTVGLRLTWNHR